MLGTFPILLSLNLTAVLALTYPMLLTPWIILSTYSDLDELGVLCVGAKSAEYGANSKGLASSHRTEHIVNISFTSHRYCTF